jgi:hypothetical protein
MSLDTTTNFKTYIDKSVDYATYLADFELAVEHNTPLPESEQISLFKYYPLNLQRTHRIHKQYTIMPELLAAVNALAKPIYWLVITEPWCGDSAQNLPVIADVAEQSGGKINLRIVYRDENPELIDRFLTNGGRSIPKLIQLTNDLEFIADWGPRPAEAQALVFKLKADNIPHDEYIATVHKWYADDKAQSLSTELVELLGKANK